MNSLEITRILRTYCPEFGGVFAANEMSQLVSPSFSILNTDEVGYGGKHWIAMYINDERCEFFDSFGNAPIFYHNYWHDFLLNKTGSYYCSDVRLQKPGTDTCGKFCIYYVIMRRNGISFQNIIRLLSEIDIDSFVTELVKHHSVS